jgi:2-C-methyl-D-erythritol 2,4-cyclodiphosphate synthase
MDDLRIGLGFDVHPRDEDRPLVLGGIAFEGEAGLRGHSDGDAVCHAIADAALGAAGLGDLGEHFPDTDESIAGIVGTDLLARAVKLLSAHAIRPSQCDATVVAERPAIAPRRAEMQETLAKTLGIPADRVSVKATRPEGLGLSGDGVACIAIVVLHGT